MAAAVTWRSPANTIVGCNRLQLVDSPAGLISAHLLESLTGCGHE
jgi:hypothetical protein